MSERYPRFPNKLLVLGVFFLLVGGLLLLWTFGYLNRFSATWPVIPLIAGLVLLYFRVFRTGPDYYLFVGTALVLAGALLLLTRTAFPAELIRIWPLFMTIVGVSMFIYGRRKSGAVRVTFTVPGAAMVLLSAVFLTFALELLTVDFVRFVSRWWPIILVLLGLSLVIAHVLRSAPGGEPGYQIDGQQD